MATLLAWFAFAGCSRRESVHDDRIDETSSAAVPSTSTGEHNTDPQVRWNARLSVEEVRNRADEALSRDVSLVLTPPLPCDWPKQAPCVVFLIYHYRDLMKGTVNSAFKGPLGSVTCPLAELTCTRSELSGPPDEFVESGFARGARPDKQAAQAMIDLMASDRSPDAARAALLPYAAWLSNDGSDMGASVRSYVRAQMPEFATWLGVASAP